MEPSATFPEPAEREEGGNVTRRGEGYWGGSEANGRAGKTRSESARKHECDEERVKATNSCILCTNGKMARKSGAFIQNALTRLLEVKK